MIGSVSFSKEGILYTYEPTPKNLVKITDMRIQWKVDLQGYKIAGMKMKLNQKEVPLQYDPIEKSFFYKPQSPLLPGKYTAYIKLDIKGADSLEKKWEFIVAEDARTSDLRLTKEQRDVLKDINDFRESMGLDPLQEHHALFEAAQGHADYLQTNNVFSHEQKQRMPLYIGKDVRERGRLFGYDQPVTIENCSDGGTSIQKAVSSLIDAPYHRIAWVHPGMKHIGFGKNNEKVVFNFGGSLVKEEQEILYPRDQQRNIPIAWNRNEIPDPLRIHSSLGETVGYPLSYFYFGPKEISTLKVEEVSLQDEKNNNVAIVYNTPERDEKLKNGVFIFPRAPLKQNTKYFVKIEGTLFFMDGSKKEIDQSWSFITEQSHEELLNHRTAFQIKLSDRESNQMGRQRNFFLSLGAIFIGGFYIIRRIK